jgi:hypothetical protein
MVQIPGFRYDSGSGGDMASGEHEKRPPRQKEVVLTMHSILRVWLWGRERTADREPDRSGTKKV